MSERRISAHPVHGHRERHLRGLFERCRPTLGESCLGAVLAGESAPASAEIAQF